MSRPVQPDPECPSCAILSKRVAELTELVKQLQRTNEEQAKEIARLNSRAKPTSRNSSTPPSQDPFRPRESKSPSSRKQGAQPGHEGKSRKLSPPDEVHTVKPCTCGRCGAPLSGDDPAPYRHQVSEIPPPKVIVTEHQLHALECEVCGHTTRAELPDGISRSQFGPNVYTTIATNTGRYNVSRRDTQQMMADSYGLEISLGSISNIEHRMSQELAPAHAEALEEVQAAGVKHADETTWREKGKAAYMWTAAALTAAAFLIRPSRGSEVAKELLTEAPSGVTVTDRYSGYSFVPMNQRQVCWSHLDRDFEKMAEGEKELRQIGMNLLTLTAEMFERWHSFRDGNIERGELARHCTRIRLKMFALLDRGARSRGDRTPSLCRGILKTEPCMWVFVDVPGVEPTNNYGERTIRPAVKLRKSCFGSQSKRGSRFVERMQTVSATLALRNQNLFHFLRRAADSSLGLGDAPSLRS